MKTQRTAVPYVLSAVAGFGICLAVSIVSGRREAWDSSLYFVAGIPAMCLVMFAIAYAFPDKAWRWALAMAAGQSVAMLVGGGSLSLWPLALVAMAILSAPQLAVALVASRIARERASPPGGKAPE